MTLSGNKRPDRKPMGTVAKIVTFGLVAVVLVFVVVVLVVSGQSFF